ncbi:sensor histidine kinase [Paractinoplanes lichenicola]|uniref:histidine kinase n=1 Tax=Paractinoplanes lichenicola TaxID=2802976 RepID=A0ABS1W2V0_9ACTN|nr:HAMP domain-containing sensor histidine kinase [Actinoplanes lichenicola]MBL7261053.1 HAMP domain-containing histidine kinase [Actinoplanes lichenicola]
MRRSSLLLRLLALSAVVSVLSVAATAWLAVRTTTRAIQQEQVQALTDDARIYDALLGYAATHKDWSGAGPLVDQLAASTGHRIALTTRARTPLADSGGGTLPARVSATVDPLGVDTALLPGARDDRIDARAVGPFRLTPAERANLRAIASRVAGCLREPTAAPAQEGEPRSVYRNAVVVDGPSGRPHIETPGNDVSTDLACSGPRATLAEPTETEARALRRLDTLVDACVQRQRLPAVRVGLDNTWTWADQAAARAGQARAGAVADCLAGARREQLTGHVAPAALLFVTTPGTTAPPGFDLSPRNRWRVIGVAGVVLLVAVGVTALVGVRMVRPLRALTAAAGRMRDGDDGTRVAVTGRDEIARLGTAFNAMAERRHEVEQLRRAMVNDVAHEMRTPVTNIRGWLEAADEGVVPLDRELTASLLEEALLLQHVIDDLQDLAAADAGELRLHPIPVRAEELLGAVADAFAEAADRAGVALIVDAAPVVFPADPIRLRQALGNLVANAIRHTPPGGRVTLSARTGELAVADTGPGIPSHQLPMVFERFWRAEPSRNRRTGGSGLGLSIVRKLAEAHGGSVAVTSTYGQGATFVITLPGGGNNAAPPEVLPVDLLGRTET